MKKKVIVIVLVLIGVIFVVSIPFKVVYALAFAYNTKEPGSFVVEDYQKYIDHYEKYFWDKEYYDVRFGEVTHRKDANRIAKDMWERVYGYDKLFKEAFYDSEADAWLVHQRFLMRGEPHIIIDGKDGRVMAIWNYK